MQGFTNQPEMQAMSPCRGCYGQHLEVFDPFSLYFWDNCPFEVPFKAPFMVPPPPLPSTMQPCIKSKIEYKETPEAHLFTAEHPGLKKEDVKVQVDDGNVLYISAKSKYEREEKKDNYYQHVERGFGEFVSKFKLPHNARPELRRTYVKNGFLTVTVPKE
uniref:SHSP domain-containing protein n=1 Tax=Opuntia streptacantha TaxID=393608 RepID=A0A7C9D3V7_OPUST